jgi:hypothetical protein
LLFDWNHKYVKYKAIRDEMQTMYATNASQMTFFILFQDHITADLLSAILLENFILFPENKVNSRGI